MSARILVVDDDPIQRSLMAEYLALEGFDVSEADNGARALARALGEPPDLILLDIQMPEMCGYELVGRIRSLPPLADVPVLLVSSVDAEQGKVRGLELGADDFISKPCAQAELLTRVRAGLRRGRSSSAEGDPR